MQDYRKLRVWAKAHTLALAVRSATRRFPRSGYSSLQAQMVRAAESVVLNIVEGSGSQTSKEFARFLDIAIKSTRELESRLELAKDYGALPIRNWETLTTETIDTRRMLSGLRLKVLAAPSREASPRDASTEGSNNDLARPK